MMSVMQLGADAFVKFLHLNMAHAMKSTSLAITCTNFVASVRNENLMFLIHVLLINFKIFP